VKRGIVGRGEEEEGKKGEYVERARVRRVPRLNFLLCALAELRDCLFMHLLLEEQDR
jgi:hypothetical protein